VTAFVDTNVFVRHLTRDPPDQGAAAAAFLAGADELYVPDVVLAETVFVLESYYKLPRARVAELVRAIIGFPATVVVDEALVLRALEVYELERLDFAEAYLVACAETSGVPMIASFDRSLDRIATVTRIEPGTAAA
jgi:predicted nucleic acid-binding protein